MNTPLYNSLIEYSKNKIPFHMPGHKFGRSQFLQDINLFKLDATEASGLDNLYSAEGIIKEAMEAMADFYGTKNSIFLTNGSTSGILASILAICKPGEKIIVARNCHYSVWNALVISGAIPIYVQPEYDSEAEIVGSINPLVIKQAIQEYPDCKGAILVSPTYEGITSDIQQIADLLHQNDKILIVDEAHGAHFILGKPFPKSALQQSADIVIHSMHKTLPALTQSGLLHLNSERIEYQKIIEHLKMIQTSSPSYVMMALMDYVRGYIEQNKDQTQTEYVLPLLEIRKSMKNLHNLKLFTLEDGLDSSKIVILTNNTNIDGYQLAQVLEEEYKIVVEAALPSSIICMTTMADCREELECLRDALVSIDKRLSKKLNKSNLNLYHTLLYKDKDQSTFSQVVLAKSTRDIKYATHQAVPIEQAEGKTCASTVSLYPPGIPILAIGETITKEHIKIIQQLQNKVQGLYNHNQEINIMV